MRRAIGVCVIALAFAVVGPATAQAKKSPSTVAIDTNACTASANNICTQYTFFGEVGSSRFKCKRNRSVKLFHTTAPGVADFLGGDRTSRHGFWGVRVAPEELGGGRFYARATRRVLRNGDVCKGATSEFFIIH